MQVRTWFGIFTLDEDRITGVELFKNDIDSILERLANEPLLLRGRVAGEDLRDLAIKHGFITSQEEYDRMLHEVNIRIVREQLARSVTPERQISAAIEAIDDIDRTGNILAERLKEWYMLNFNETDLKGSELARHVLEIKEQKPESRTIQSLASGLLRLYEARISIEEYLEDSMHKLAPNLTSIAGYILGARLLSVAGSLERLASMPSSRVQVLGANNALFKHLKGKATSPKHGLIFRHPYVNTAPKWQRGKIARALAAKISLASRYDCYSEGLRENLHEELERKVFDIRKRTPNRNSRR